MTIGSSPADAQGVKTLQISGGIRRRGVARIADKQRHLQLHHSQVALNARVAGKLVRRRW